MKHALPENKIGVADHSKSLYGWELGMVPPKKRRRTIYFPGKAKCTVCGHGITNRDWQLYQTCDYWKCRTQHRQQQRMLQTKLDEHEQRQRNEFERRVCLLRNKAACLLGIDEPERFVSAVIPATQCPVTYLPQERRSAIGDHLEKLIIEAHKKRIVSPNDCQDEGTKAAKSHVDQTPLSIVQEACAMCRGNCCLNGGDRAYLTVETILRYSADHPELESHEVRTVFLLHVEERTTENSCIYHGKNGCHLPRAARSTTCNEFECAALKQLLTKLSGPGPYRVFLVATQKNRVIRYAFVHV